jgi:flavin-dependent dehydrogenase
MSGHVDLPAGGIVAVVGGGPSGAFFSLELLSKARAASRPVQVMIFERRQQGCVASPSGSSQWHGCNCCAGGVSPKLYDELAKQGLHLPEAVIQSRIEAITIQGFWKNIELEVPPDRRMFSVFRGSRPHGTVSRIHGFDSFLLGKAIEQGAKLISSDVRHIGRSRSGKPLIRYGPDGRELMEADFCVLACGINKQGCGAVREVSMLTCASDLMPGFQPPRTRKTLIFELAAKPEIPGQLRNSAFFVEYGSREVPLEMCSLLPKRDCITVVLIGPAVDRAESASQVRAVIAGFLQLPHIRQLLRPVMGVEPMCMCGPRMVVGSAKNVFGERISAVGDFVTSRLYKDGILSAHRTSAALAETVLKEGIDLESLKEGYGPTLRDFEINNRIAGIVFFLHRLFFSSSVLSRILYQAVITERKTTFAAERQLENILWRIASGDDDYGQIMRSMLRPRAIWAVLCGGAIVTARSYATELLFGLRWEGIGRFTTGVSIERLEAKRAKFRNLIVRESISLPQAPEFERMYTIKIAAPRKQILAQLENFGEANREYLRPRGVRISRVAGLPHEVGCVIRYQVWGFLEFDLQLEKLQGDHLAVYRVVNGFASGGILLFEIEPAANEVSLLSIYVAFNFKRGEGALSRAWWGIFRSLFPSFVHDVLWNHSLCHVRDLVENRSASPMPRGDEVAVSAEGESRRVNP